MSTTTKLHVQPRAGLVLRYLGGDALPPDGALRPSTGPEADFWRRREREGDVVISTAQPVAKARAKSEPSTPPTK